MSEAAEHVLQVLLAHRPGQPADVQVSVLDHVRAGPRKRHLVEGGDGAASVVGRRIESDRQQKKKRKKKRKERKKKIKLKIQQEKNKSSYIQSSFKENIQSLNFK